MEQVLRALLSVNTAFLLVVKACAQPGSVDPFFDPGSSVDFEVFAVGLQSNGKVIIGGTIGTPSPGLARLNPDGTPDKSFKAGTGVFRPSVTSRD